MMEAQLTKKEEDYDYSSGISSDNDIDLLVE
jgi:hypothetical protein